MALLQRTRILPQQRLDLPDFRNIEDFVCADFKAQFKNIWTGENFVLKGFESTGLGTNELNIVIAGSALIVGADDGTMFIGAPSVADAVTDALTPASTNYIEISIEQDTGGADSRAFWDPTAAAGQGGEFSQIVDTFIFTKVKLNINTSNFTGAPDMVPVCEVDVNGSGIITDIRDARNMFWRLGRRGQAGYSFPWVSRTEPPVSQFNGADKDISSEKDWKDAVMSRIQELDGGTYWYEHSGVSLVGGFRNSALSMMTGQSTDAKWSWDGSLLKLTDSNVSPADADPIAALRLMDSVAELMLTRQDGTGGSTAFALADGDVLWIELPEPLADVNYNAIGLTASNFRVSPRGSVPNDSNTFWLAMRDGANVYLRYFGELQPGEDVEISDNINENILAAIGLASETDMPNYTSNNIVVDGTSLVAAISALDAAAGLSGIQSNQDRSLKVIEGGTWHLALDGQTLSWSADAFVDLPEVTRVSNRILAGNVVLPNANSVAYVEVNRASGPASLTVQVGDIDAIVATENTVVIARRAAGGVLVGTHSFLLKAGEYLELDGALAEINRYFGQLRLIPHPSNADRVVVTGADVSKLSGSILSQSMRNLLLKFDGAEIDFETGSIYEEDGTTPLGVNFTPSVVPANQWAWYSVTLIPSSALADNRISAQLLVLPATGTNAVKDLAARAPFANGVQLGQVAVQRNAGNTAFNPIVAADIVQLGVGGGGGGSGTGDANADLTRYQDRLNLAPFEKATPNIAAQNEDDLLDPSSTATFDIPTSTFKFGTVGAVLTTLGLADDQFLADGLDAEVLELYAIYDLDTIDTNPTFEVSRDGGANWQAMTMDRIEDTDAYRGLMSLADEPSNSFSQSTAAANANFVLNATTVQAVSQQLTVANTTVFKQSTININKATANAAGRWYIRIVKDSAGSPSLSSDDIVFESGMQLVSALSVGNNAVQISGTYVLVPGTYHLQILTDAAYKAQYTINNADSISARTNNAGAAPRVRSFNGTVWSAENASNVLSYTLAGRVMDLRVRITGSVAGALLKSLCLFYKYEEGSLFKDLLLLEKLQSTIMDNHLGSENPEADFSQAGRGVVLKSPNGTKFEITVADDGSLNIYQIS